MVLRQESRWNAKAPANAAIHNSIGAVSSVTIRPPVRLKPPRSKYRAVRVNVDGIVFHSKREANRYCELKLLEKSGEIGQLEMQCRYALKVVGQKIGSYVADFTYWDKDGNFHCEDVKGFRTPLYRWKKKHFEAQYGITIQEV